MKVYYGKAVYSKEEVQASIGVLKNKSLTLIDGPSVKKLESQIANTNDENERSMCRLKKLHEEEVVGLKAAVAQAVADLNSQKLAFDTSSTCFWTSPRNSPLWTGDSEVGELLVAATGSIT